MLKCLQKIFSNKFDLFWTTTVFFYYAECSHADYFFVCVVLLVACMLSVIMLDALLCSCSFSDCHYAEYHYAVQRYAKSCIAQCHYAECSDAEYCFVCVVLLLLC